ncbi:MAG TPA: hypothetical protein VE986_05155, partial [Hyphomicrobiales bacterium]|nr:hypothetical protein [Hyphomicrobiales bacterium]
MRNSRRMSGDDGQAKALVPHNALIVRNSDLAVIPPRPLPLTFKARRSFWKLTRYTFLAGAFAFVGYGYRDTDIRRFIDYQFTLLFSSGVSSVANVHKHRANAADPLPAHALSLFSGSRKGPRADKFAYALQNSPPANYAPRIEASGESPEEARTQTAALAGATLFMTMVNRHDEAPLPPEFEARAPAKPGGEWAGLLKNASLSPELPKPEESKTLFGGLTEDEFRTRELRCMATAIYFEARD